MPYAVHLRVWSDGMAADGGFGLATPVDLRRVDSHPDHWYPLAWSEEVKPGKVVARRLMGEPVAIYRSTPRSGAGRLFALEDRCAHRQVPLSMGVVLPRLSAPVGGASSRLPGIEGRQELQDAAAEP